MHAHTPCARQLVTDDVWTWRYVDALLSRDPYAIKQRECLPYYAASGADGSDEVRGQWVSRANPLSWLYASWTCCASLPRTGIPEDADRLERCQAERAVERRVRAVMPWLRYEEQEVFVHSERSMPMLDGYCDETDEWDVKQMGTASCERVREQSAKGLALRRHPRSVSACAAASAVRRAATSHSVSLSSSVNARGSPPAPEPQHDLRRSSG
jgi:hypothetical protein